jgi:hypothetical protein
VLSDAASLGVPVIVPAGTWLADRIDDGSATGHVYSRLDASTLRSMLDVPAEQRTALLARAAQAAAAWRDRNSHHRMLEVILDAFGVAGSA